MRIEQDPCICYLVMPKDVDTLKENIIIRGGQASRRPYRPVASDVSRDRSVRASRAKSRDCEIFTNRFEASLSRDDAFGVKSRSISDLMVQLESRSDCCSRAVFPMCRGNVPRLNSLMIAPPFVLHNGPTIDDLMAPFGVLRA